LYDNARDKGTAISQGADPAVKRAKQREKSKFSIKPTFYVTLLLILTTKARLGHMNYE